MALSRKPQEVVAIFSTGAKKFDALAFGLHFDLSFLKHASEIELLSNQIQALLQKDVAEQKLSVRKQFEKYDTNKEGSLTFAQLNQALLDLGFQASPGVLQNIIGRFDSDNDGKVSLEEFFGFFSVTPNNDVKTSHMQRQKSSLESLIRRPLSSTNRRK